MRNKCISQTFPAKASKPRIGHYNGIERIQGKAAIESFSQLQNDVTYITSAKVLLERFNYYTGNNIKLPRQSRRIYSIHITYRTKPRESTTPAPKTPKITN